MTEIKMKAQRTPVAYGCQRCKVLIITGFNIFCDVSDHSIRCKAERRPLRDMSRDASCLYHLAYTIHLPIALSWILWQSGAV